MQKTVNQVKRFVKVFTVVALSGFAVQSASAQKIEFAKEKKAVVKHYRFVGDHREESMWSALYGAKSGKIYIGLCCHAEAAHFYEFDPATEKMRHIVDLTELHEERGEGINTNGKIHVRMGEDNEGNISSLASKDYVDYCHSHGVDVWGLVSNFELDEVDSIYVLTHTSTRQNLVNQIIAKALQYNLDGINIDFEAMNSETLSSKEIGDAYIQFLRELSIKCENNDLVLSTDVLIPGGYNGSLYRYNEQIDFVDYVIVMAYDEHYGQKTGAGSVASLDWTENAVKDLLEAGVPSNQLVLGIPFYSKLWSLTPKTEQDSAEVTYVIGFENLGMSSAENWMSTNVPGSDWKWLEDCGQFYGETTKKGVIYKMWLEDTTSLEERLKMMKSYNLAGAAFWKSGLETDEVWDIIIKYIN
jgi:spore germination protein YaaH